MYPGLLSAAMLCVVVTGVLVGGALAQSPGTEKENMVLSMPIQVKQITRISKHCSSKVFGHVRLFFS